jgi:hypothetical protein
MKKFLMDLAATSAYLGIEQAKALDIAKNHKMF